MCDFKLSSDEVPTKFSEWLLAMGCPPEKVPPIDKVVEMCRGQYYMVWRSLMEHVEAKDVIRHKRINVFCDDIHKWKRKNAFNKPDTGSVMPTELMLWHQHNDLKEKVTSTEKRVMEARHNLDQLMEKISSKLSHRNLSHRAVQNGQRRAWLLQQVAEDLKTKKENLDETRSIADSLSSTNDDVDVQSKLDRYIASTRRGGQQAACTSLLAANPVASSSVVSNGDVNDNEESLSWLAVCRGDALWTQLLERRAGLVSELTKDEPVKCSSGSQSQSIVSHTAAMHCSLALEALKNRAHIKQTRQRLATAITNLNTYLSGEACELLVVRCEVARASARVSSLRALASDVTSRAGAFAAADQPGTDDHRATTRQITALDKAIENKRDDLKRLVASLAATETKIHNVRECLINIFNGFHKDVSFNENYRHRGQIEFPAESCATLRQFYEDRRERRRQRVELSMDLDVSDHTSFTGLQDNPKFADEIRIYLKKFNLEKNKKLVLDSGEKIWSFESLASSMSRLQEHWRDAGSTCNLLAPVTLSRNLRVLVDIQLHLASLHTLLEAAKSTSDKSTPADLPLKSKEEESEILDNIKKRLNLNLLSLQKTNKTLALGQENIKFWSENYMRKIVSYNRQVSGKTYKDYEEMYMINLS